jgi:hypothetical protein
VHEPWRVSAAWIARLGGELDKAHFLVRPGDAEEPPGGQALLKGPAGRPHTHAGLPYRALGGEEIVSHSGRQEARADNFGNRQRCGPVAHGTNCDVTEILIGPVTPLARGRPEQRSAR